MAGKDKEARREARKKTAKRWLLGVLVVLGILLLISEHSRQTGSGAASAVSSSGSGGAPPCTVMVTVDSLNVRSSPDGAAPVVETFGAGAVMPADRTIRNGFRQLGPSRWAAQEFLDPKPGTDCG